MPDAAIATRVVDTRHGLGTAGVRRHVAPSRRQKQARVAGRPKTRPDQDVARRPAHVRRRFLPKNDQDGARGLARPTPLLRLEHYLSGESALLKAPPPENQRLLPFSGH